MSWFRRKEKHRHVWETISQAHERQIVKERDLWGNVYVAQDYPKTVYTLRCKGCGEIAQRRVDGFQPPASKGTAP